MHGAFGVGIFDAAYLAGVTVDRLRYAEQCGRLPVPPRINNRPCYDRAAVESAREYFAKTPKGTKHPK